MTIFKFYTYYLILVIDQVKMHSANYTLRTLLFCIPLIHAFDKIYCTKGTDLYSIWKEWYLKIKSDFVLIGLVLLRIAYLISSYHKYTSNNGIYTFIKLCTFRSLSTKMSGNILQMQFRFSLFLFYVATRLFHTSWNIETKK